MNTEDIPLVERVVTHGTEPVAGGAEEIVEVALVLVVVEMTTVLPEAVRLIVALWLEDEARLRQDLMRIGLTKGE